MIYLGLFASFREKFIFAVHSFPGCWLMEGLVQPWDSSSPLALLLQAAVAPGSPTAVALKNARMVWVGTTLIYYILYITILNLHLLCWHIPFYSSKITLQDDFAP